MKHVRGSVVRGYLRFIKRFWGEAVLEEFLQEAGLESDEISEIGWYDIAILEDIHRHIAETKDVKYIKIMGNYTPKDLGVLGYLVRFSDIKSLLQKAPKSYAQAYDFGEIEVEWTEKGAIIKMTDVYFDEYSCLGWLGAFEGMLEITHTIGKVKEIKCQRDGDPQCVFEMTWK